MHEKRNFYDRQLYILQKNAKLSPIFHQPVLATTDCAASLLILGHCSQ